MSGDDYGKAIVVYVPLHRGVSVTMVWKQCMIRLEITKLRRRN